MEQKRILTIQDISCVGQCSITVALPILSACGHETCILPTAMLSTHTGGFQHPVIRILSDSTLDMAEHWKREGIRFDAIYVGYLGSIPAIAAAARILDTLLAPGGITVVDPAMGDHGKLYSGFDMEYAMAMKGLCEKADIILPNITEAAIFSGIPYEGELSEDYVERLLSGLSNSTVILTGVGYSGDRTGILIREGDSRQYYGHTRYPRSCHGTGDIFASCFLGAMLRGKSLYESVEIAGDMVCLSIRNTEQAHWYGVRFETMLPELIRRLDS